MKPHTGMVTLLQAEMPKNPRLFFVLSLLVGSSYFLIATVLLHHGHLHEDAYILFQYARNLANGYGIVFDQVSGPTEGATDFLWLVALSTLSQTGLNLGTAAALLNGIGLSVLVCTALNLYGKLDIYVLTAIGLIALSGGTAASLGGFSSLAYGGIYSLMVLSIVRRQNFAVMLLGLLLALFRPDGVLLALGGGLIILWLSSPTERKRIIAYAALAIAAGLSYFFWRAKYFGLWLPLPLIVKARTDTLLEGLGANIGALYHYAPLIIAFIYCAGKMSINPLLKRNFLGTIAGPMLLLVALSFAHQSQNVGNRFQFPILLSAIFVYLLAVKDKKERDAEEKKMLSPALLATFLIFVLPGLIAGCLQIRDTLRQLTNTDYINSFPQQLKQSDFAVHNIAITEAGRFPYWFNAHQMIDLVGLNSAQVTIHGPLLILRETKPELIFVHHAGTFDISKYSTTGNIIRTTAADIRTTNSQSQNPVIQAPLAALEFAKAENYEAIFVRYGSKFKHVYFLSRDLDVEQFIAALEKSFITRTSYHESESDLRISDH